ncbi:galactose-1-phosphate uridylyltransferase [Brevibacillus ginsengisoli]|uniref:galactose-1-phosphate uridylyltransferase n=1 Tax=Brevibacillus ginsengisoli TaxID=363854 RepID=UPI003CF74EE8
MPELRFNPLLRDWTIVASNRQHRPHLQNKECPFCPGSGKVPDEYTVYMLDNDFPALTPDPDESALINSDLYQAKKAYGKCEVILYSSDHHQSLAQLTVAHIQELIELWALRFSQLAGEPEVQYILIFENRGEEVGVTMTHPHGQIYAYSQMPLKIRRELESCQLHYTETGKCLLCEMNEEEKREGERLVIENNHFLAYIPYFTDYPYGVFIVSKSHKTAISDFNEAEKKSLATILKQTTGAMDELFARPFPYMMVMHQRPVNGEDVEDFYHFHIEFYPPLVENYKLKHYASSEMGAWAVINPKAVEETAPELREAVEQYRRKYEQEDEK